MIFTFAFLALMPALSQDKAGRWQSGLLKQRSEWYATDAARTVAESVLQYQSPQGGWPKNTDLAKPLREPLEPGVINSFDNEATTLPMHYLALMVTATSQEKYRAAFDRGLEYILAAQYPNGGWPQFYPLRKGYYSHITYNDNAMTRLMALLQNGASGRAPFGFVSKERRALAASAVAKGVECILKTQIRNDGKLTAWCAQYDEKTMEPAWARAYEPPSLSGSESVGIVRFLMEIEKPTPAVIASIEGAVAWLKSVAIDGKRLEEFKDSDGRKDRRMVEDSGAPRLWARFYELGTHRAIYLDRDSVVHYDFSEIGYERRNGYSYHGTWAASLIERDYPRWRTEHSLP